MSKDLKEGAMCKMRGKHCIRGNSMCKGPGVVAKLVDWKKSKGAGSKFPKLFHFPGLRRGWEGL